jgi:hypothetical protein
VAVREQSNLRGAVAGVRACGGYAASDGWHDVLAGRDEAGRWQVLDAAGSQLALVETLTGHDDRLDQAQALARDYASQQVAYRDGLRRFDPLPRPQIIAAG